MAQVKANANGNLFEIKTVQSGAFRSLIEAVKELKKQVEELSNNK